MGGIYIISTYIYSILQGVLTTTVHSFLFFTKTHIFFNRKQTDLQKKNAFILMPSFPFYPTHRSIVNPLPLFGSRHTNPLLLNSLTAQRLFVSHAPFRHKSQEKKTAIVIVRGPMNHENSQV